MSARLAPPRVLIYGPAGRGAAHFVVASLSRPRRRRGCAGPAPPRTVTTLRELTAGRCEETRLSEWPEARPARHKGELTIVPTASDVASAGKPYPPAADRLANFGNGSSGNLGQRIAWQLLAPDRLANFVSGSSSKLWQGIALQPLAACKLPDVYICIWMDPSDGSEISVVLEENCRQ